MAVAKVRNQQERERPALLTALPFPPRAPQRRYVSSGIEYGQKAESDLCGRPGDEPGLGMV